MDHHLRRAALAGRLPDLAVDGFLVNGLTNVRYLTGFTGSNGQVLVTGEAGVFFTDGRYTEQARHEVAGLERETYLGGFGEALAARLGSAGVGVSASRRTTSPSGRSSSGSPSSRGSS